MMQMNLDSTEMRAGFLYNVWNLKLNINLLVSENLANVGKKKKNQHPPHDFFLIGTLNVLITFKFK